MATKVRVIQQGLRYRLFSKRLERLVNVMPKIGDLISLPDGVLEIEIRTGNVRKLNKEEKMAIKAKAEARKNKKKKNKKKVK